MPENEEVEENFDEEETKEVDAVNLPSLNAVDAELDVNLAIEPQEAKDRLRSIDLTGKDTLKDLLEGIEAAKAAKVSASKIINLVIGTLTKVVGV